MALVNWEIGTARFGVGTVEDIPCFTFTGGNAPALASAGVKTPWHTRGSVPAPTRTDGVSFDSWIRGVTASPTPLGLPSLTQGLTEVITSVLGLSDPDILKTPSHPVGIGCLRCTWYCLNTRALL